MTTTPAFAAVLESPYRSPAGPAPEELREQPEIAIPYDGQSRMRLVLAAGASDLILRVDPNATQLLHARFDGPLPRVVIGRGEVRVRYRFGLGEWIGALLSGDHPHAEIVLHPAIAWDLVFRGGASRIDADLRHGILTSLELGGGASDVELELPVPQRSVPLRFSGGASSVSIHRPAEIPAGARMTGGVSSLTLDDRHLDAIGGPVSLESDGFSTALARYDIRITGGASDITITARR